MQVDPRNPVVRHNLGTVLLKVGKFQEAETHLRVAVAGLSQLRDGTQQLGHRATKNRTDSWMPKRHTVVLFGLDKRCEEAKQFLQQLNTRRTPGLNPRQSHP